MCISIFWLCLVTLTCHIPYPIALFFFFFLLLVHRKAERKYGKDANHIKKAEEEARIRAEKKAARKAKQEKFNAQRDASTANAQRLPNRRTIGAGDGSASIIQPPKPRAKPVPAGPDLNDPTLHPSWIAKQTEKAAMAAALSGAKSNKITFDDSD